MRQRFTFSISIVTVLMGLIGTGLANESEKIGKKISDFELRSCYGSEQALSKFADKKIVVVAFLGTECPLVKLYADRLVDLANDYVDRGVAVVGINSNSQDTVTEIVAFANRHGIKFPLLKDPGNKVADQFGAIRTPEVFVLDENRTVRYWGRIDDQYGIDYQRDEPKRRDLAVAIDELLAGKSVTIPSAESIGCFIGRVSNAEPTGDVTYSNQVSRILNKKCVECHREGQIAPFSLTSFEDTIGWGETIVEVIEQNRMPPWHANPEHGNFKNDPRLSQSEKEIVFQWIENGMPEGDPKDLPEPPKFHEGWRIDPPDQIIYMRESKKPFTVPAQGVVDYQHFTVDPGWTEDKYIRAAEARPGNTSVVHHIIAFVAPPGSRRFQLDGMLVGYAPGSPPIDLQDGKAIYVPAGSKLVFQMHYTPNGTEQTDLSYVGVKFIDEKDVTKLSHGRLAINDRFQIPPHSDSHEVKANNVIARDSLLIDLQPHMHLRGKAFTFEAVYPDGNRETLLDVPNYDFNWQLVYALDEPKLLPKGTRIQCKGVFDNSENNLSNPDPSKPVRWGDQSWEEMMIGFFSVVPADREPAEPPKTNVTGVWQWGEGNLTRELHLAMQKDGKLDGKYVRGSNEIKLRNAQVSGHELWFEFPLVVNGEYVNAVFDGEVDEQQMKGKVLFDSGIRSRSIDLVATRQKKNDE